MKKNNYIIALLSTDKDIMLEPLATFSGDTMYFKTERDAKDYVDKLLDRNGLGDIEAFEMEALKIIRVQ